MNKDLRLLLATPVAADVPVPQPGAVEVLVRVEACTICFRSKTSDPSPHVCCLITDINHYPFELNQTFAERTSTAYPQNADPKRTLTLTGVMGLNNVLGQQSIPGFCGTCRFNLGFTDQQKSDLVPVLKTL